MSRIMEYPEAAAVGSGDKLVIDGAAGTRSLSAGNALFELIDSMPAITAQTLRNTIIRGKNLGTTITTAQKGYISDGSFTDMFLGDYWRNGNDIWIIAGFNISPRAVGNTKNSIIVVSPYATSIGVALSTPYSNSDFRTALQNIYSPSIVTMFGTIISYRIKTVENGAFSEYTSTAAELIPNGFLGLPRAGQVASNAEVYDQLQLPIFSYDGLRYLKNNFVGNKNEWSWGFPVTATEAVLYSVNNSFHNKWTMSSTYGARAMSIISY